MQLTLYIESYILPTEDTSFSVKSFKYEITPSKIYIYLV